MTGLQQRRLFEVLFAQHSTRILGYLVRRVDSPEDAADLMAEAFTVAWRRIDDAPTGDEARLWLYGIARNVLANHRRGNSRRGRLATRLGQELAVRAQAMHEPESASRVRDVLATLPERDRELLTLTAWEDMTPGEIATVLGLDPGTVRTRLSRARTRLKAALDAALDAAVEPSSPAQ